MALSNDHKTLSVVRELRAFIDALPTGKERIDVRYADEYHGFVDQLELLSKSDLAKYRLAEGDIRTTNDVLAGMGPSISRRSLPDRFNKPLVVTDRLRMIGNRLLSFYEDQSRNGGAVVQHITISGEGNQTVVGVAGGSLNQSAEMQVRPGDDVALIAGLESLAIDQELIDDLKALLDEHDDPDGKKSAVRKWIRSFTGDVLTGTISGAIASQAPAALAMALGYLS